MTEGKKLSGQMVFGLDIGTRSIVGTVGYRSNNRFYVVAQRVKEHETRAMLDGQIHDILKVSMTIRQVKEELEAAVGMALTDVCIAAAGRVLRTVNVSVENEYGSDKEMTKEDIYELTTMGVEKAYEMFQAENDTDMKFYCVGYSVVHYYINHYPMSNPEGHKARVMGADMIATFLPDDVVDGLYKAVELAGLQGANMTLEPIAAIQVAIPEMYRMLNIALVDVGAGTSDISITKDGSIIAFGMIPTAGDSLTETIARHCLVDFVTAENIKKNAAQYEQIEYKDIMGLAQSISRQELLEVVDPVLQSMAVQVSDKIKELNGGKSVSAVFVVGGGGKLTGYTEKLAGELGIQKERVAVRGEEVMQSVEFLEDNIVKDSLLVTPIGICLSYYEQSNNFIFAFFNEQRVKLFDNNMLAVVDAAMQAEFPNDGLFPRRGKELNFSVNGKARIVRGQFGEAALISVNGEPADIHTLIHNGDKIEVVPSTVGEAAEMELGNLPEFGGIISVMVNGQRVELPKFASVNGRLQSRYYDIQEQDAIELLNYYTVKQVADFMDVLVDKNLHVYVNNKLADMDTYVYENFSVEWTMKAPELHDMQPNQRQVWEPEDGLSGKKESVSLVLPEENGEAAVPELSGAMQASDNAGRKAMFETAGYAEGLQAVAGIGSNDSAAALAESETEGSADTSLTVTVNGRPVTLAGKLSYVFVDVFDYIDFDLSKLQGSSVVTLLNGRRAQYMEKLGSGDTIEIYWKK